jgi:hypothetical protein
MNPIGKHLTPDMALLLFDREGPIIREMFAAWLQSGGKSPSFNHAWFIWDWMNDGPPTIGYGP